MCEAGYPNPAPTVTLVVDAGTDDDCEPELRSMDESLAALSGEWTGEWTGEINNGDPGAFAFTGAPTVTLRIHGDALAGSIRFGQARPLPPIEDPGAGYLVDSKALDKRGAYGLQGIPWIEGFEYPIQGGQLKEGELWLSIPLAAPWSEWCALQSSHDWLPELVDDSWQCTRNGGQMSDDDQEDGQCTRALSVEGERSEDSAISLDPSTVWEEDCGKVSLCEALVCACTQEACRAQDEWWYGAPLRLQMQGDRLEAKAVCDRYPDVSTVQLWLERK
jgi:hypothetical protein